MGFMKNINQIFKTNTSLMDHPEVEELIVYCRELEGEVTQKKIDDTYNKEEIYLQVLKDIYESCGKSLEDQKTSDRFREIPPVDFKMAIVNLKKYLDVVQKLYGFTL